MESVNTALFVRMVAKPGREVDVETFLKSALDLAVEETGTVAWFALRLDFSTFAIFDAFPDEFSREAHLNGHIAKALMTQAADLLADTPSIEKADVLAAKLPMAVAVMA